MVYNPSSLRLLSLKAPWGGGPCFPITESLKGTPFLLFLWLEPLSKTISQEHKTLLPLLHCANGMQRAAAPYTESLRPLAPRDLTAFTDTTPPHSVIIPLLSAWRLHSTRRSQTAMGSSAGSHKTLSKPSNFSELHFPHLKIRGNGFFAGLCEDYSQKQNRVEKIFQHSVKHRVGV